MAVRAKPMALGMIWALLLGLAGFFAYPLLVTPWGYVWIIALLWLYAAYGWGPSLLCAAIILAGVYVGAGSAIALGASVIVAVVLATGIWALHPRNTLPTAVLYLFLAISTIVICAIAVFQMLYGDLVTVVVQVYEAAYAMYPELTAELLASLSSVAGASITVADLLISAEDTLRLNLPSQILTYGLYGSSFSMLAAYTSFRRQGVAEKRLKPFSLDHWSLPKYTARSLLGMLLLCGILYASGIGAMQTALNAVWGMFYALFTLQGIASLAFLTKMRGMRKGGRFVLIVLLFLLLRQVLFIFGLLDRISPLRQVVRADSLRRTQQGTKSGPAREDKLPFPTMEELMNMAEQDEKENSEKTDDDKEKPSPKDSDEQ